MNFIWHKDVQGRHGVMWRLTLDGVELGRCYFLPGSRKYRCSAKAPVRGGSILFDYQAGTAKGARRALEREWDKRSIGLFGVDDISFAEMVR